MANTPYIKLYKPNRADEVEVDTSLSENFVKIDTEFEKQASQLADIVKVNVKTFGAKGDGVTDDTLAIQEALDFAETNKCYVYFPDGKYIVTSTLYLGYNPYIRGSITGFSSKGNSDTLAHCVIVFENADTNATLFAGKTGVTEGQINFKNIAFHTHRDVYYAPPKYRFISGYHCKRHSRLKDVQINGFNYVFYQSYFNLASRMENCAIRNLRNAVFYQSDVEDAYFYNNYFSGVGADGVVPNFFQDTNRISMSQFVNNWFEFFKYIFKSNTVFLNCVFVGNLFDYTYRVIDKLGRACTATGNTFRHCGKEWMTGFPWIQDAECMADNDWVAVTIAGNGTVFGMNSAEVIDRFIELVGNGADGAIKEVHTFGNVIGTIGATTPLDVDKLVRVSVPQTSSLGAAHLSNMKIEELNNVFYTSVPTTGLIPGRTVFINNKRATVGQDFQWYYADSTQAITEAYAHNAVAIRDTAINDSAYINVTNMLGKKTLYVWNTLNQSASISIIIRTKSGTIALVGSAINVGAGGQVLFTSTNFPVLNEPIYEMKVRAQCATAPTTGTLTTILGGVQA